MKININYLEKNHMTRCTEKIKKVKYIIINDGIGNSSDLHKEYKCINNLTKQDEVYYSVHYIIGSDGKCFNIVPEDEVTFCTRNIELNYYIISIECCSLREEFNNKIIETLIELIICLKKKYNLSNKDILLNYDLSGSRNPKYYVDNRFKFLDILDLC